jgi:hypothetical protein
MLQEIGTDLSFPLINSKINELQKQKNKASMVDKEIYITCRQELKDVQKLLASSTVSAEERLRILEQAYTEKISSCIKLDKQVADLKRQADLKEKEREKGKQQIASTPGHFTCTALKYWCPRRKYCP